MQCNQCGSDHTQRLQMVFEGGTHAISSISHTTDIGSLSGALGISDSVTRTSGVSRSVLVQKMAPPEKRNLSAVFLLTLIGFLCLRGSTGFIMGGLAMMAVGLYGLYNSIRFNRESWPRLYQRWLNSWLCHKCGNVYHQQ
jgi:hypothetical protein